MIHQSLKRGFTLPLQNWFFILILIFLNGILTLAVLIPARLGKTYFLSKLEKIFDKTSSTPWEVLPELLELVKRNVDILIFLGLYLLIMLLIWDILLLFFQGGIRGIFKEILLTGLILKPTSIREDNQQAFPFFTKIDSQEWQNTSHQTWVDLRFKMKSFLKYSSQFFSRMLYLQVWLGLIFISLFGVLVASSFLGLYLLDQPGTTERVIGVGLSGLGFILFLITLLFMILMIPYTSIVVVWEDTTSFKGITRGFWFVLDQIGGVVGLFFIFLGLLLGLTLVLELGETIATYLGSILSEKNPSFKLIFSVLSYFIWSFFQSFIQLFMLGSQMTYYMMSHENL